MKDIQKRYSGQELQKKRTAHLLTQAELAEKVGVSSHTIISWENGRKVPGIPNLRKLLAFFEQHES